MSRDREIDREKLLRALQERPKFELGQIVATPNANEIVSRDEMKTALARHQRGDWGDLDEDDRDANNHALEFGLRLLSAYTTEKGNKFWIITEADRSVTTVLLPEDY